jgi:hypothetical protein
MSDPAAPWWAEVQHLRPREDTPETPAPASRRAPSRRFARAARQPDAAIATLEHEVGDPWAADAARDRAPWDEPASEERHAPDDAHWDEPAAEPEARTPVWDDSLEEAFARTPSWADDEDWLLPKGADRIENGRRTIEIRGQVDRIHGFTPPAETSAATRTGRRGTRSPSARFERRPDRVAMWAFLLGVLLILVAAFSKPGDADAATRAAAVATPPAQVAVVAADGTLARR